MTAKPKPITNPSAPRLISATWTLAQPADSNQEDCEDFQYLHVSSSDAGAGPYLILKTDRWAIDRDDLNTLADQLQALLDQVKEL